jgi:hypothetical protein
MLFTCLVIRPLQVWLALGAPGGVGVAHHEPSPSQQGKVEHGHCSSQEICGMLRVKAFSLCLYPCSG